MIPSTREIRGTQTHILRDRISIKPRDRADTRKHLGKKNRNEERCGGNLGADVGEKTMKGSKEIRNWRKVGIERDYEERRDRGKK